MATYNKNFAQMSTKRLTELLPIAEPEDVKTIAALIKSRQDMIRSFVDKFIVIKHVGNDKFFVREFDDRDDAKKFVDLLRKSEQLDFIKYSISQTLNY